jgi:phage head maturation protease
MNKIIMLRNNLIILSPKRETLDKTNNKNIVEIRNREKNTYFNKIIGYKETFNNKEITEYKENT